MFLDAVQFMHSQGLTDTGKYVVIGVRDDEPYTKDMSQDVMFYGEYVSLFDLGVLGN